MFSYIHLFVKFLLGDSRVLLTDPELIKYVVVTNAKNYRRSEFVRQVLPSIGNGLFSSNGKDHAFQRKLITPAFHFSNLVGMVEHFEDVAHNLVQVNLTQFNILNLTGLSAIIWPVCGKNWQKIDSYSRVQGGRGMVPLYKILAKHIMLV